MKLTEKQLTSKLIYKGPVFTVYRDEVLLPDDQVSHRDYIKHNGGVCIAAKDKDNNFFLVQQFRYPLDREMIEFPAGKKEKGEDPLDCAMRELVEETGYKTDELISLGCFVPTCGYSTEIIYMYYADKLTFVGQNLDQTEFLNVIKMPLSMIMEKISNNEIIDSKTIIMAYKLSTLNK